MTTISFNSQELNPYQLAEFSHATQLVVQFSPSSQTVEDCFKAIQECFSPPTRQTLKKQVRTFTKQAYSILKSATTTVSEETSRKRSGSEEQTPPPQTRRASSIWGNFSTFCRYDAAKLMTPQDLSSLWREQKMRELDQMCENFRRESFDAGKSKEDILNDILAFRQQATAFADHEMRQALQTMETYNTTIRETVKRIFGNDVYSLKRQSQLLVLFPKLTSYLQLAHPSSLPTIYQNLHLLAAIGDFLPSDKEDSLPLHFEIAKNFLLSADCYFLFLQLANPFIFQKPEAEFVASWKGAFDHIGKPMDVAQIRLLYTTMRPFHLHILDLVSGERYQMIDRKLNSQQLTLKLILELNPETTNAIRTMDLTLFASLLQRIWPSPSGIPLLRTPPATAAIPLSPEELFPSEGPQPLAESKFQQSSSLAQNLSNQILSIIKNETWCQKKISVSSYQIFRNKFVSPILIFKTLCCLDKQVLKLLKEMDPYALEALLENKWPRGQQSRISASLIAQYITDAITPSIPEEDIETLPEELSGFTLDRKLENPT